MSKELGQQDLFRKQPVWWEGLTGRRRLFVEYYCTDRECFCNAAAAYVKAFGDKGLSDSSIQSNSSRLRKDPKIRDAVARLMRANQNEEDQITEYEILKILKTLSTYKTKDIIDENGNIRGGLDSLGELSICVTGIRKNKNGGKEIKLYDRTKSLALLCNYLQLTRPEERATVINPVVMLTEKDVGTLGGGGKPAEAEAQEAEYELVGARENE